MRALSEQGFDGQDGDMGHEYRERYGQRAFDQYLQEESQRDEQSQYGREDADGAT